MNYLMEQGIRTILERQIKYLDEFLKNNAKMLDTFQIKEFNKIIGESRTILLNLR